MQADRAYWLNAGRQGMLAECRQAGHAGWSGINDDVWTSQQLQSLAPLLSLYVSTQVKGLPASNIYNEHT